MTPSPLDVDVKPSSKVTRQSHSYSFAKPVFLIVPFTPVQYFILFCFVLKSVQYFHLMCEFSPIQMEPGAGKTLCYEVKEIILEETKVHVWLIFPQILDWCHFINIVNWFLYKI
ncbi:hypothetical protein VPH35_007850 [Triticum aestivum]